MRTKLIGLLIMAANLGTVTLTIQAFATSVDKATETQCLTHDWPKEAHTTHLEWCVDNGYSVN